MAKSGRIATAARPCAAALSFDSAQAILAGYARPLGVETVPLTEAAGCVLAAPVIADIDSPWCDVAAMDGYAVRTADLCGDTLLRAVGSNFAGVADGGAIEAGEAMRVMTGAPLPRGADRVVMIEHCRAARRLVRVGAAAGERPHVRLRASDFPRGEVLLAAGRRLTPGALVTAAAADVPSVIIWRRPRIGIVATGDEIAAPGSARGRPGAIPDSLSIALAAFCGQWGAVVAATSRVADDPAAIRRSIETMQRDVDVIVLAGGASRGDRDHCRETLKRLGLEVALADLAIKPGKPLWFGRLGGAQVLGLPGNPTAALTVARLFLAPLLAGLGGHGADSALRWEMLRAAEPIAANGPREAFLCATDSQGGFRLLDRQEASGQARLGEATLLVRREANAAAAVPGALLPALVV